MTHEHVNEHLVNAEFGAERAVSVVQSIPPYLQPIVAAAMGCQRETGCTR
jgi:hypothetical protein